MARWTAPVLEGRIIRLEPLSADQLDGIWDASRDPGIWQWLPIIQPQTSEEMAAWLADALERAEAGLEIPFATVRQADGVVVGSTRFLALRPEHGVVEIGWTWLAPSAWGTGANQEAKLLQFTHAFETWGCRRVELKTDALNAPARGAMDAFGASFEGIHRQHMLVRRGENRDSAWYSVLDGEWPAVRDRLVRMTGP